MTPLCEERAYFITKGVTVSSYQVVASRQCGHTEGHESDHMTIFDGQPIRWSGNAAPVSPDEREFE